MPVYRARALPGLPPREPPLGPYRFEFVGLELRIPVGASFMDQARPELPEQESWIHAHPRRPVATWDCLWTFADVAARDGFIADLVTSGAVEDAPSPPPPQESPTVATAKPATSGRPAIVRQPGNDCVLEGPRPIDRVEIARVGRTVVCVGITEGVARPWDIVARRTDDPVREIDTLVAAWGPDFHKPIDVPIAFAQRLAAALDAQDPLWVTYRFRGIGGAPTTRVLVLSDRVAFERLGKKRALSVFATHAEALAKVGPHDVATGLASPTADELAEIAALGAPKAKAKKPRKPPSARALAADATPAQRIAEGFRRLETAGILARRGLAGPQSHAWEAIATARESRHRGAVFYVAAHGKRAKETKTLYLYWASWADGVAPAAFATEVGEVLRGVGLDVTTPETQEQAFTIAVP